MIVDPDFLDHWKTKMLIAELGDDKLAPLYVLALWAHCQLRRCDTFHGMAPNALKGICRYEGEASRLRSALERCEFIEVNGEAMTVHEWAATNAKLVANWKNGKKGGRPKKPNDNPPITQAGVGVTHAEPIGKDRRGLDKNSKKQPTHTSTILAQLGPPWNTPECVCVFDQWFEYLGDRGKLPTDPALMAVSITRMFSSVEQVQANMDYAKANGWTTIKDYLGEGKRGLDEESDRRIANALDNLTDDE